MIRDRHAYMLIQKYIRMMNTKKKFKDFSNFILIIKIILQFLRGSSSLQCNLLYMNIYAKILDEKHKNKS